MNITDYIVSLLKSGTNVELNGIGAFVVKSHDAYLDETTNTFYPKRQTIEFQPYSDNKGNIVQLIAKKECVSENVAGKMWDNFYQALCDKMKSQSHEFPGLGNLSMVDGSVVFEPSEDARLADNGEMSQPLTNVEKVNPVVDNDPFAVFDNPESLQEPEPEPEPEDMQPVAPAENEAMATEPTPEPDDETISVVADPEPASDPEPEPEPTPEPIDQPQHDDEPQTVDALFEPEPEPQPYDNENIAENLQNILDDEPDDIDKSSKKDKKSRNYKIIIILLIVLLLLMGACGLYYFFFMNKQNNKSGDNNVAAVSQSTGDNNVTTNDETSAATPANEEQSASSENSSTTTTTANTTCDFDYGKYANSFTYNPTFVELDNPNAVPDNREAILKRISGRLNSFLQSKQYSTATEKMKGKLTEFIDERLDEKLNNTGEFHFSQLFNGNQFAKDYINDELKERKQKRARYEVIDEIFSNGLLSKYLNELINAGEVQKDVAKAAPAPVYTAPIYSSSKQGFDVIAGTYRDKQSALKMASNLRSKGAGAYVIERGGLYYVSAGSAPSRTSVERVLFQLKTWYTSNLSIKQW